MPIECLNGAIRTHVVAHITAALIRAFVLGHSFVEHVCRRLCSAVCAGMYRQWQSEPSPRDVEGDVTAVKLWLREAVGRDWQHATRTHHPLARDLAVTFGASRPPWEVQRLAMRQSHASSYWAEVQSYVQRLAPWQTWVA